MRQLEMSGRGVKGPLQREWEIAILAKSELPPLPLVVQGLNRFDISHNYILEIQHPDTLGTYIACIICHLF